MSKRSRAVWRLSLDLAERFGLRSGAVEVRWDKISFSGGYRRGWLVSWADGPTVEQMRAAAQELAGEALAAERDRGLAYERAISPLAFAMQLIAVTEAGEEVDALDDPVRWEQRLAAVAFPERPTDAGQERLARLLVATTGLSGEPHFARALASHGPAVVISLERERSRRGRGGPG